MNNFSPNMLKTFETCPKKFYFKYVQNISVPQPVSFFEKGKKIHRTCKLLSKRCGYLKYASRAYRA